MHHSWVLDVTLIKLETLSSLVLTIENDDIYFYYVTKYTQYTIKYNYNNYPKPLKQNILKYL